MPRFRLGLNITICPEKYWIFSQIIFFVKISNWPLHGARRKMSSYLGFTWRQMSKHKYSRQEGYINIYINITKWPAWHRRPNKAWSLRISWKQSYMDGGSSISCVDEINSGKKGRNKYWCLRKTITAWDTHTPNQIHIQILVPT